MKKSLYDLYLEKNPKGSPSYNVNDATNAAVLTNLAAADPDLVIPAENLD